MDARSALDVSLAPEDQLTTILEGIGEAFYAVDRDWRIVLFNAQAAHHFGFGPDVALGRGLWDLLPSALDTDLGRLFVKTMAAREMVKSETPSVVFPGRWLAYRLFPLGDGMGVVFRDITDRKSAEEHRDLLLNELNHRVKNTLAIVQALAAQTFRHTGVDRSVQRTFEARLLNLSEVHNVLTDQNWDSAELHDVVRAALRPHCTPDGEPFRLDGPALRLRPKSAVALSMTLHELCTNATKYGALSVEGGHVTVNWHVADGRFRLRWQEHGGPPVTAPSQQGFGSRLIQRSLAAEFLGQVKIAFEPTGVICTIDAPFDAVRDEHPTG